ncbi:beta-galactosidase [Flavobacterium sp. HJJ]|uniref:beta-galactosidase n=1 Tax=Flavobacterium sp. HJJ TaxID=2783792 RepID=UPI00188BF8E9|nr:beta-galactosidase [Flavobacterium sp. HJJ]MBF4473479.1 beta-galactosidase [Flavobacterium sp. HJJ]
MKKIITAVLCITFFGIMEAQKVYEIDTNVPDIDIYEKLKLGGTNPKGEKISVNNYYMSVGNKPVIPIVGEFHFSRYPRQYWDESIRKIKAGGVNVIATYVFWNLHEEKENTFDWSGDKDLRYFLQLCQKNNIETIVRIGPFCHGEIRSGGMPDWLLGRALNIRSNDPLYLKYVERLYNEIGKQLKGLYYKNGGPIIGIQIENEYQHSAAPWGLTYPGQPLEMTASERDMSVTQEGVGIANEVNPYSQLGNDHMKILKSLALSAGMDVPLYTATGWGNAAIIPDESIPVTAAYAYPFWTPTRDYSPFFLYKDMHRFPDYAPVRYSPENYPAFSAELGSGIMSVYTRRPIAVHKSFDALINRCLGSGANGIGYYMYHGGSTPKGKFSYMSDEAYGLPKISYDFQAPIGEYGQVREGFQRLKLLHFFLQDYGHLLAPMATVLPLDAASLVPQNISSLRYAVRKKGSSGFIFLNNFQDDTTMVAQKNIRLNIKTAQKNIMIPETGSFDLDSDENVIFPYNLDLDELQLNYATAQLLAKDEEQAEPYYIFFTPSGIKSEFSFSPNVNFENLQGTACDKNPQRILVSCNEAVNEFKLTANGKILRILVISKEQALKMYSMQINGKRHFIFSNAIVLENGKNIQLLNDGNTNFDFEIYPKIAILPKTEFGSLEKLKDKGVFSSYKISLPQAVLNIESKQVSERKWALNLPLSLPKYVNDAYLTVQYIGDTAMGFIDGELVTDEFYKGIPWEIGLRKFLTGKPQEMVFYFRPMQKNASYLVDLQPYPKSIPDFGNKKEFLSVNGFTLKFQYTTQITF